MKTQSRRGFTALELVMSFTLLTAVTALSLPLIVAHSRLLSAQRDYRVALAELSNQFERLSLTTADELPAAVENLAPSEFAAERLPGAELHGEVQAGEFGQRVTLKLTWDEPNRSAAPMCLTAWLFPKEATP